MVLFALFYLGLLITQWPYAVPPDHTFWDAASDPGSQLFLLIGVLFSDPDHPWLHGLDLLGVFRGKVRTGGRLRTLTDQRLTRPG